MLKVSKIFHITEKFQQMAIKFFWLVQKIFTKKKEGGWGGGKKIVTGYHE